MDMAFYFECYDPESNRTVSVGAIAQSRQAAREYLACRYPQCRIAAAPHHARKPIGYAERIPRV